MLSVMRRPALVVLALFGASALVFSCKKKNAPPSGVTTITSEPSSSTSASPKSPQDGPLKVAAMRDGTTSLGVFDDGSAFVASGVALAVARGTGDLARDAAWSKGLTVPPWGGGFALDDVRFGGRFPENAWVSSITQFGRGSSDWSVSHYQNGAWTSVGNTEGKLLWFYAAYGPWKDGKTIALRLYAAPDPGGDEAKWGELEKLLDKTTARFEVPGEKSDPSLPTLAEGARPATFASLATGEAIAVATFGSGDKAQTKIQRWTAGDPKGSVEVLPGLEGELMTPVVAMSSASSAWVGGNDDGHSYLAHFDGKTWARSDVAMKGIIASIAESADGTAWVIAASGAGDEGGGIGELWKRPKDGKFKRVDLPKTKFDTDGKPHLFIDASAGVPVWKQSEVAPGAATKEWFLAPRQVVVNGAGEPFVMAIAVEDESGAPGAFSMTPDLRTVILRTRGTAGPLALPSRAALVAENEERTQPALESVKKATDCQHFFVRVQDVPEGSPVDWDPKELRAVLATVKQPELEETTAYEVLVEGKRAVGLYAPLCGAEDCRKWIDDLMTTLTKKMPVKPTLYCRTPLAVRELGLTFAK